jgi:hypothetical protein
MLTRLRCLSCNSETIHRGSACIHCGTRISVVSTGEFNPAVDSAFAVSPYRKPPSSKSRRKSASESGMPVRVTAEGGSL